MDSGLTMLRKKIAAIPYKYFRSSEGRKLQAKILVTVRRESGREAAREVRKDFLFYSVMS